MMIAVDEVLRERLFILTIAAERGWRLASRVAFRKKGDYADKDLAKELKDEDRRKRKLEETDRQPRKKKPHYQYHRDHPAPGYHPPVAAHNHGYHSSTTTFASTAPQGYSNRKPPNPRPETRTCINCRQVGHLLRNCPTLNSYQGAAQGAAPR